LTDSWWLALLYIRILNSDVSLKKLSYYRSNSFNFLYTSLIRCAENITKHSHFNSLHLSNYTNS